ncbi:hypothetical protein ACLKA7_004518 [Drosophila subpalustris]
MLKYPRTSSSTSSGYFDDDEALMNMNPYQTPPSSPQCVPQYLQRHMVRMFSTEELCDSFNLSTQLENNKTFATPPSDF